MKRVFILILAAFSFISCNKKNDQHCTPAAPDTESAEMQAFCIAQNINYTIDENGIYYQAADPGSGIMANINSTITATYTASTLDGNIVEDKSATAVTKKLSDFIEGFRIGLTHIQKGGRIKIVIPSFLAYGCTGIPNLIAPNSPLYYDVVLINVE